MKQSIIIAALIPGLLLIVMCSSETSGPQVKQEIKHIYNESGPGGGKVALKLEERFRIEAEKDMSFSRSGTDSAGNIFIVDPDRTKIYRFNPEGKLTATMIRKGAGPGELAYISMLALIKDRLYAASGRKIAVFDTSGKLLQEYKFKKYHYPIQLIGPDQFLVTGYRILKDENGRDQRFRVLELRGLTGKTIRTYIKKTGIGSTSIRKKGLSFNFAHSAISPDLDFACSPDGRYLFYAVGNEYKIFRSSLAGKVDMIIHKKHDPVKLSPADREEVVAGFRGTPPEQKEMIKKNLPEYLNVINRLQALPGGYLMAYRLTGASSSARDLFDPSGQFLYTVEMPKNRAFKSIHFVRDRLRVVEEVDDRDIYIEFRILNMPWVKR